MRISTQQMFSPSIDAMQDLSRKLNDVQQQLATGKRILQPSDDPAGAVQVMRLKEASATYGQYQRNADAVRSRLELEEGTLSSMQDLLQRVRELNVQGLNDTYSAEDRAAIATEIREQIKGMVQLLNTQDANGDYMFSGTLSAQKAVTAVDSTISITVTGTDDAGNEVPLTIDRSMTRYAFEGNAEQRVLSIGPERQVEMGDGGSSVLSTEAGPAGETFFAVLDTMESLAWALETNFEYTDAGGVRYDLNPGRENTGFAFLDDFDKAIEDIGLVQAKIGARLNAIDAQSQTNDAAIVAIETNRSSIEDLDYAEAAARLNLQLTALQAAQQSFVRIQGLSLFNYL